MNRGLLEMLKIIPFSKRSMLTLSRIRLETSSITEYPGCFQTGAAHDLLFNPII